MRSRRKSAIVLLVVIIFLVAFMPVKADSEKSWQDETPTEYEGIWSTQYNYGIEEYITNTYKILLIFTMYSVDTDADDYKIEINYDGVDPGWPPWIVESLDVLYRWGLGGGWTHLVYLDTTPINHEYAITTATSSVFQIRFIGCAEVGDGIQHTWTFEEEPTLWAFWD